MSAVHTSPSKVLASRFAHLAYTPKKNSHAFSPSNSPASHRHVDRLGSDVDSDDLDGENPADNEQHIIADEDLRPVQVKHEPELELDLQPPSHGRASPYFPVSLKRKPVSSPLTSPPSSDAPSPKKKSSVPIARKYADPSKYAEHHPVLTDLMREDADCMFVGINPGLSSAKKGHHYAGATNRFWNCLHQSGFTPQILSPTEDHTLPTEHSICMTNLVARPTASASELSAALDLRPNVPLLLSKIAHYRPRVVCFVGKDIWKEVEFVLKKAQPAPASSPVKRSRKGKEKETEKEEVGSKWEGPRGWKMIHGEVKEEKDDEGKGEQKGDTVEETYFWVVSSTSGLVRDSMQTRLECQWRPLLSFITDLKQGVKPWLAPSSSSPSDAEREFREIALEAVDKVVQEMVRKNEEKKKVDGKVKAEDGGLVTMDVEEEQEDESGEDCGDGRGRGWKVVQVWEPDAAAGTREAGDG